LAVISSLDLTEEQRDKLNAIQEDFNKREKGLVEKIAVAGEKLQKLQQQHIEADQSLRDLNGHLATANMDAANRAEELLTAEQRQRLISGGAHIMMPAQK
jgi:Spy/CpxP family protein refolding chaperone